MGAREVRRGKNGEMDTRGRDGRGRERGEGEIVTNRGRHGRRKGEGRKEIDYLIRWGNMTDKLSPLQATLSP